MQEEEKNETLGGTGLEIIPDEPKAEEQEEIINNPEEPTLEEEESEEVKAEDENEEESQEESNEEEGEEKGDEEEEDSEGEEEAAEESNEEDDEGIDPDEFVAEETNGRFSSVEELIELANQEVEEIDPDTIFANEQIKKLNELASNGVDILEVLKYQALGVSDLDPSKREDALKLQKLRMVQEEGLTEKQAEKLLSREYNFDADEREAEDIEFDEIKLMREAKKSKQWLEDKAKDFELPNVSEEQKEAMEAQRAEEERAEAQREENIVNYQKAVRETTKEYKEEFFELDKENSLTFALDKQSSQAVKGLMENPESLWQAFVDEGGTTDMEALRTFATVVTNFPEILKSAFNHGMSVGQENLVKNKKNPERRSSSKKSESGFKSAERQIAENLGLVK